MAKYVIFLGAGASASEGAPVQSDLFKDYFSEVINNDEGIPEYIYKYFNDFWGIALKKGQNNNIIFPTFEEALGMLELAKNRRESFRGFRGDYCDAEHNNIDTIIENLIFLIADILHRKLKHQNIYHTQLVYNLIKENKIEETAFISLNYDILIDNAILEFHDKGKIDLDYGIDFMNYHQHNDCKKSDINISTKLFKIHGSLNWLYCPVCKQIKLTKNEKGVIRLIETKQDKDASCPLCEEKFVPILVPPTFFKVMSNPFLIQIWEKAEYELRQCEKIVFCGYSMPDADIHIKYLLKRGVLNRNTPKPEIIIINNNKEKCCRVKKEEKLRYKRLFGSSINYTSVSFQKFAGNPSEYLENPSKYL